MIPVQTAYPKFEANQVLTSEHLNTLFAYLDEQGRLTRTNLIGIGIVCGLEPTIAADGSQIVISKGCGVTSEGYLVVWDNPQPLEFVKPYTVPDDIAYAVFNNNSGGTPTQYPLWELTEDRNNDPAALPLTQNFLRGTAQPAGREDEKVLLLFLECKTESNKNCSPNSCDDKGAMVTATVRPLLIRKSDMDAIQANVRALGGGAAEYLDLSASTSLRFNLPEVQLRRYNVESSRLATTDDVFNAYQNILNQPFLNNVADAFSAAYTAFRPLLLRDFPADPFANLKAEWAYLHNGGIVSLNRYLWYQYYYDHLDTVLQAYNEFREVSIRVMGLCCPDSRVFPRHLMLANVGVTPPEMSVYRHHFVPSPLYSKAQTALSDVVILFKRLVELLRQLDLPPLSDVGGNNQNPIKITPSKLGAFPLSDKAIPYHYRPNPLVTYWDYRKTRYNKARFNLGYRSPDWNISDDAVLTPLRYDLEPNNFLRVEGHVGRPFDEVLSELLSLKAEYRLPIEIVGVKTGRNSDAIEIEEDLNGCQFRDLEALYDALREELLCTLCEGMRYFYDKPYDKETTASSNNIPQMPLFQDCAPGYRFTSGTVGSWFETYLTDFQNQAYIDIDQNNVNAGTVFGAYCLLFANKAALPAEVHPHAVSVYYLMKLAELLPERINLLELANFENKYQDLNGMLRFLRSEEAANIPANLTAFAPEEELIDYFDHLLFSCKLEPIRSVHQEYERRKKVLRDQLLLANFAKKHPGIQHKAGVPLGGTFIVVYHGENQSSNLVPRKGRFVLKGRVLISNEPMPGVSVRVVGRPTGALTDLNGNFTLIVNSLPVRLRVSSPFLAEFERIIDNDEELILLDPNVLTGNTVSPFSNVAIGEVIGDFYLPYLCCSDCEPVQFVLPKVPPTFRWERAGCTTADGLGPVKIIASGGAGPYQYTTNGGANWSDFTAEIPVLLANGVALQIRDSEGTLSIQQTVQVAPPMSITVGTERNCNEKRTQYSVPVTITNGLPPYNVNGEVVTQNTTLVWFDSGKDGAITVTDSNTPPCTATTEVKAFACPEACTLPCGGVTMQSGHLFWLPLSIDTKATYRRVRINVNKFVVSGERNSSGEIVTKTFTPGELKNLSEILSSAPSQFQMAVFHNIWSEIVLKANDFIQQTLGAAFGSEAGLVMNWTYDANSLEGFAVLNIERYTCHQFNIDLEVGYDQQDAKFARKITYNTLVGNPAQSVSNIDIQWTLGQQTGGGKGRVPGFNSIRRNRCTNGNPVPLCKTPIQVNIPKDGDQISALSIVPVNENDVVFWEFNLANPTISQEFKPQEPQVLFSTTEVKVIRVQEDGGCATSDQGFWIVIF